jgi:hypothetical protein
MIPTLEQAARQVMDHLVARALDGEFLPGVSWVVDTPSLRSGPRRVRFFIDGDLDATLATMDPAPEIPDGQQLRVRGEVSLELNPKALRSLRRAFGIEPADDRAELLVAGYREGLALTLRTVDELEARACSLADRATLDLDRDLQSAGHSAAATASVTRIFGQQKALLQARMDKRRARLDALSAELEHGADPELLERILGDEYAVSSAAQTDVTAFEDVIQRALRAAAHRF